MFLYDLPIKSLCTFCATPCQFQFLFFFCFLFQLHNEFIAQEIEKKEQILECYSHNISDVSTPAQDFKSQTKAKNIKWIEVGKNDNKVIEGVEKLAIYTAAHGVILTHYVHCATPAKNAVRRIKENRAIKYCLVKRTTINDEISNIFDGCEEVLACEYVATRRIHTLKSVCLDGREWYLCWICTQCTLQWVSVCVCTYGNFILLTLANICLNSL